MLLRVFWICFDRRGDRFSAYRCLFDEKAYLRCFEVIALMPQMAFVLGDIGFELHCFGRGGDRFWVYLRRKCTRFALF